MSLRIYASRVLGREMRIMLIPVVYGDQSYNEEKNKMTKTEELELLANRTMSSFYEFLENLAKFKNAAGLKNVDNMYEVCTSMADKNGRIARLIKHVERKDPKIAWRQEISECLTGYLSYAAMIIEKYNMINIFGDCMIEELMGSVKQHATIEENKDRDHVGCRNDDVVSEFAHTTKLGLEINAMKRDDPTLRSDVTKRGGE